ERSVTRVRDIRWHADARTDGGHRRNADTDDEHVRGVRAYARCADCDRDAFGEQPVHGVGIYGGTSPATVGDRLVRQQRAQAETNGKLLGQWSDFWRTAVAWEAVLFRYV